MEATATYDKARKFATKAGNSTLLKDIEEARTANVPVATSESV